MISIGEIKSYSKCPLFYKFKYIDNLPCGETLNDVFKSNVRASIFYYYFSAIEKKVRSISSILKKWESLWFSNEMKEVFTPEELRRESTNASMLFNSFYKTIDDKSTPVAVNFTSESTFPGDENLHVTGTIDLIRVSNDRTRNSSTDLVMFKISKGSDDDFMLRNDIALTLASHAFRTGFKKKEDNIIVHNLQTGQKTTTTRTGADFSRAEKIIRNVLVGIRNKVFYPSPNKLNCQNCKYKLYCLHEKSI